MAVLTVVNVNVADYVRIIVRDRKVSINSVVLVDITVDRVIVDAEDHCLVTSIRNLLGYILETLLNQKFNSSVGATDECHDWRFVRLEASSPLFGSARARTLIFLLDTFLPCCHVDFIGFTRV